jgi:DNA-binding NarL/FixJ family response regulator
MVGFEWCSNPVMWTYTTVHTLVGMRPHPERADLTSRPDSRWVLVVEADAGIRKALEWCINQQDGFRSIACESAESFAGALESHHPYLVLLNRNLAERLGFDSPGRIAPIRHGVPAVTYSVVVDGDRLFVSTPGGAEGYVLKRVKPTQLLDPILNVVGPPDLPQEDLLSSVKSYFKELLRPRSGHDASGLARLTRRENEVLVLLSKGCVDKEVARALGISAWTVHGHIKNIFKRLHVRTRTEAVVRYLEK